MTTYAYGGDPTGLAGKYHYGIGSLGTRGDAIPPTGDQGPGYIYPSLALPADAAKEYYGVITSIPAGLHLDPLPGEDSAVTGYADADGVYVVPFDLYEFGVLLGSSSFTMTFGTAIMLAGASTTFGLTSGTGAVTVDPPVSGTINLAGADATFGLISGTGAATITPAPSTINLTASSALLGLISGTGLVTINGIPPDVVVSPSCTVNFSGGTNRVNFDGGSNRVNF